MKARLAATIGVIVYALALLAAASYAANDRPLIYGMNPTPMEWWGKDPNVWDPILFQKMAAAGCTSARIGVNWDQIEPTQGVRDWTGIDRWVRLCLDNNIEPVILINSTPEWALPGYVDPIVSSPTARYPPAEQYAETFKRWCYDLVRRYRGRARYYEFWNEANGYGWYTALLDPPSYSRADLYTPWMIRAYKGCKLGDPTCQMSTTGIDDSGSGHASYFLEQIYSYGGEGYFDAVADHPYPEGGNFQPWKMSDIRYTLDSYGDTDINIWITEFGYNTSSFSSEIIYYFDSLTQNQYDYVRIATWHTANEFPWEAGFGLLDSNLYPKPEYYTFKNYPKPARPTISNITATPLTASSAKVTYTTDVPARGLVMYGPSDIYGMVTSRETAPAVEHEAVLLGLSPGSTYHYRIRAGAVEDGDSFSADQTVTTPTGPVVHIISGPTVSDITDNKARVSWTTDVPSTSSVQFSTDFAYDSSASSTGTTTNHTVELTGLQSKANYQYRVVSAAEGYAHAVLEGEPFTTFAGYETLANAGFEDGATGWTYWEVYPWRPDYAYQGHISVITNGTGAYLPTPPVMEGSKRVTCDVGWASAVGGLYQTIRVPNGTYLVSGWVASGVDGGTESIQLIAMDGPYTGGIPEGVNVADLTESTGWTYYTRAVDITTEQLTIALRVSQWSAVDVVAGHFDGISVTPATKAPITALKGRLPETKVVTTGSQVVSAVFGGNTLYIQEPDRSAGIKVVTLQPADVAVGQEVSAAGTLRMINGEAVIDNASVTATAGG